MPIATTVVGSYPVPDWLRVYPTAAHLRDAITTVVATQERLGIDVVSDGELSRFDVSHPETNGMIEYFIRPLDGIRTEFGHADLAKFSSSKRHSYRKAPAGVVQQELGPGTLNLPHAAQLLRDTARHRTKFTLTSPYMLARVLIDEHYGGIDDLTMAIADILRAQVADIDTDVIQIDEAHVTGHPEDGELAAAAINHVLSAVAGESAVHLCFGNYGGQTVQDGRYHRLLPFINALHANTVLLETARRDASELEALTDVDGHIGIGLGVIDIKDNAVEGPDQIARRVEAASRILGDGRVTYVNPDCGFWMLQRSVADAKMASLAEGRDLFS